jgi:Zn-dependent peptidase ImmA (M78 family)
MNNQEITSICRAGGMEMECYRSYYDKSFLKVLDTNFIAILDQLFLNDNEFEINIREIVSKYGIDIEENDSIQDSGEYQKESRKIVLKKSEPEVRKRFTIAHELGHAVLDHKGETLYRKLELAEYTKPLERIQETNANQFAANILMPRKLVVEAADFFTKEKNISTTGLDAKQQKEIIVGVAYLMNISEISMTYRANNIELFVPVNEE